MINLELTILQGVDQKVNVIQRITGFLNASGVAAVLDSLSLSANPRSAAWGSVAEAIFDSLQTGIQQYPNKTRGLLLGAANVTVDPGPKRRNAPGLAVAIRVDDPSIEGIMDGGHNLLAIGSWMLRRADENIASANRPFRDWTAMTEAWNANRTTVRGALESGAFQDLLVPVEIVYPSAETAPETFHQQLFDICVARNHNRELTTESKVNQSGFLDALRQALPADLSARVRWRENERGTDVRARDLVALTWIPLGLLLDSMAAEGVPPPPTPPMLYANKTTCLEVFVRLLQTASAGQRGPDGKFHLTNPGILSAIKMTADMVTLHDTVQESLPSLFNEVGGTFEKLEGVKVYQPRVKLEVTGADGKTKKAPSRRADKRRRVTLTRPVTRFLHHPMSHQYPAAYMFPLVYGLRGLMDVEDGLVKWAVDPHAFLTDHLRDLMPSYRHSLSMAGSNPGRFGKTRETYDFTASRIRESRSALEAIKDRIAVNG